MDRMIYTAMTGAREALANQAVVSNNLANVSTSGFRAQLAVMRSVPVQGAGELPTRIATAVATTSSDWSQGSIVSTGRELDVAINGAGWFAVQDSAGGEAYTRRGDLRPDGNGLLYSGTHPILGDDGAPLVVPLGARLFIGGDGTLSVIGAGQEANAVMEIGRLKLADSGAQALLRGEDGLFRPAPAADGLPRTLAQADTVSLATSALEGSNVSAVEGMVAMIDNARRYEMQLKAIETADENAQRANSLLSLRG